MKEYIGPLLHVQHEVATLRYATLTLAFRAVGVKMLVSTGDTATAGAGNICRSGV